MTAKMTGSFTREPYVAVMAEISKSLRRQKVKKG
jgi:hypothetical protein